MDLSIIFSTYENETILKKSLQAYCDIETNYDWELIIVDNANRQETRDVIKLYEDRLPITFIEESNPGKNNALNKALPMATGDLLFFTDNDVIFSKNIVDVVIQSAKKYDKYDIFTGKILPDISLPDWIDLSSHRIRSAFVICDHGNADFEISLEDVWGPNMVVRKFLFEKGLAFNPNVGPNGKSYAMGSETELLKRLEVNGHKAMYLGESQVFHQIRDEQLSVDWLKGRAFRSGRGVSVNNVDDSVKLFGIPRYLLRKLICDYFRLLKSQILDGKKKRCLAYMEFNYTLGRSKQSYYINK